MSRITTKFNQLKKAQKKALITYFTAGDPDLESAVPIMHALVKAGADMIELGVPFSEPMAEGPAIESAHHRALKHGASLEAVLKIAAEFRQQNQDTPIILMGYLNPFEHMGYEKLADAAKTAGVDGIIVVDLPPEEAGDWLVQLNKQAIAPIFLTAPTTNSERLTKICKVAGGYLYYVSLKGVTGSANLSPTNVAEKLTEIRRHTELPIAVGFGIRDGKSAAAIAQSADGVIVGTALVERIACFAANPDMVCQEVTNFIKELREAIDQREVLVKSA